jgi:hypothetical protein
MEDKERSGKAEKGWLAAMLRPHALKLSAGKPTIPFLPSRRMALGGSTPRFRAGMVCLLVSTASNHVLLGMMKRIVDIFGQSKGAGGERTTRMVYKEVRDGSCRAGAPL